MRAELGPFLWVQCAFQQCAEDRRFDLRPLMFRRLYQHFQLVRFEVERGAILKQIAVKTLDRHAERGRELALVHRLPKGRQLRREVFGMLSLRLEQAGKTLLGDQLAVFGEHGEQQPHEEAADTLRIVITGFEPLRHLGQ